MRKPPTQRADDADEPVEPAEPSEADEPQPEPIVEADPDELNGVPTWHVRTVADKHPSAV
ncbi:MAG TPA: hypothetical protein VFQ53_37055 [Kofleriaceae bacterium]|nr:hypothetical protein [Kofleriaceae bacterium]